MNSNSESNNMEYSQEQISNAPTKKRKVKPLPEILATLSDKDKDRFTFALECDPNPKSKTYGKEYNVVQKVKVNDNDEYFDLTTLNQDQIRMLCRNIGVTNCGSSSKFVCRKTIASYLLYRESLQKVGLAPTSHSSRVTSTVCRAVNVVFSSQFLDDFLKVNDRKNRQDHESSNMYKDFWIRATIAHNSFSETPMDSSADDCSFDTVEKDDNDAEKEFCTLVIPDGDIHLSQLVEDTDLNLRNVDQYNTEAFRKKIMNLFKIRQIMIKNMTESGTHDNDPWNFVEVAMKNFSGMTKVSVYYFFMRCENTDGVDAHFQPFLDQSLKGGSCDLGDIESIQHSTKKRKIEDALTLIANQGATLVHFLSESVEDRNAIVKANEAIMRSNEEMVLEKKRMNRFKERLELAKALNDVDELRKLMDETKKYNTST